jgi:hypothetical protein
MLNVESFLLFVQFYQGDCQYEFQNLYSTCVPEDLEGHQMAEVPMRRLGGSFSCLQGGGHFRCEHIGRRLGPTHQSSMTC